MALEKKTFTNDNLSLSFYSIDNSKTGEIWMSGHLLAESFGYLDPIYAINTHINSNNKCIWQDLQNQFIIEPFELPENWDPRTIMINELGLIQLIGKTRMPDIEQVQVWIYDVVLPSCNSITSIVNYYMEDTLCRGSPFDMTESFDEHKDYLYLISHETLIAEDIYIIGLTKNVQHLLNGLHSITKYKFDFVYAVEVADGIRFLQFLHQFYNNCWITKFYYIFPNIADVLLDIKKYSINF